MDPLGSSPKEGSKPGLLAHLATRSQPPGQACAANLAEACPHCTAPWTVLRANPTVMLCSLQMGAQAGSAPWCAGSIPCSSPLSWCPGESVPSCSRLSAVQAWLAPHSCLLGMCPALPCSGTAQNLVALPGGVRFMQSPSGLWSVTLPCWNSWEAPGGTGGWSLHGDAVAPGVHQTHLQRAHPRANLPTGSKIGGQEGRCTLTLIPFPPLASGPGKSWP